MASASKFHLGMVWSTKCCRSLDTAMTHMSMVTPSVRAGRHARASSSKAVRRAVQAQQSSAASFKSVNSFKAVSKKRKAIHQTGVVVNKGRNFIVDKAMIDRFNNLKSSVRAKRASPQSRSSAGTGESDSVAWPLLREIQTD